MTALFDGMAGVLNDVFGAPVIYTPDGGAPQSVQAVFRAAPIEVVDEEGHTVLILSPTIRVRRDLVPSIGRGDQVEPSIAPGRVYRVLNILPSGSPAADAFIVCELEETDA